MNAKRNFVFAAVLMLFLFGAFVTSQPALARHPDQTTRFEYQRLEILNPGRVWTDEEGLHIRGRVDLGVVSGDLQGTARVVYNADMYAYDSGYEQELSVPYTGIAYGSMEIFGELTDSAGPSWTGSWTYYLHVDKVAAGNLLATNSGNTLMLIVPTVFQTRSGSIAHIGSIDHLFCPDDGCPDPGDQ